MTQPPGKAGGGAGKVCRLHRTLYNMIAANAFKATITAAFDAHDLGEAAHFLGMAITRDRSARTIEVDQKTKAAQLVSKYGLDGQAARGTAGQEHSAEPRHGRGR